MQPTWAACWQVHSRLGNTTSLLEVLQVSACLSHFSRGKTLQRQSVHPSPAHGLVALDFQGQLGSKQWARVPRSRPLGDSWLLRAPHLALPSPPPGPAGSPSPQTPNAHITAKSAAQEADSSRQQAGGPLPGARQPLPGPLTPLLLQPWWRLGKGSRARARPPPGRPRPASSGRKGRGGGGRFPGPPGLSYSPSEETHVWHSPEEGQ